MPKIGGFQSGAYRWEALTVELILYQMGVAGFDAGWLEIADEASGGSRR